MTVRTLTISEVIDHQPFSGYQKMIVTICALLAFVEGFGAQNAGPVAPALARGAWHLSRNAIDLAEGKAYFAIRLPRPAILPSEAIFRLLTMS